MNQNFKKSPAAGFGPSKAGSSKAGPANLGSSTPRCSLASVITRAATAALGPHRLAMEVDVNERLECMFPSDALSQLVTALVRGAVDAAGPDGEINVTAWQRGDVLEIEVADNGPAVEARPKRLPMSAAALAAELVWQNCPQGGAAVTAVLRRKGLLREAA